jgi:predicted amidohydrolase
MEADISILEILPGRWTLADAVGQTLEVDRLLSPVMAVKGGRPFPAHPVARPSPTLS